MERIPPRKIILVLIALALLAILFTSPAYAEEGAPSGGTTVTTPDYDPQIDVGSSGIKAGSIDGFLDAFRDISANLEKEFLIRAQKLFWLLAIIQFAYATISLGRRGEFSLNSIIELLIREIMYISFFWMLVSWPNIHSLSGGSGLGGTIVGGLRKLGADVTRFSAITPSSVLGHGTDLAWLVIDGSFKLSIIRGIAAIFPAVIILIAFALAAAHTAVMLIEYYLVVPVGILMLGLGGSLWTKNYAETYLRCLFTIGIKLLCLQVVLAFSISYVTSLMTTATNGGLAEVASPLKACFFLAGLSVIIYMAVQQVPSFAAGLLSGSSSGSASALTGAMGAIGGAAMAAVGGAARLAGAGKDAYDAHKDASGDSGGSGGIAEASEVSSGGSDGGSGSNGETSSTPELPSALREDSSSSSDGDGGSSAPDGDGGSSAPDGDGGSSAPGGDGGSSASGDDGGSSAPDGDGGSSAPAGDGGSSAPSGDNGSAAPDGDGGSSAPSGDNGSAAPAGDGGSSAPSGDDGSAAPAGDGGSSAPSGDDGSAAPAGDGGSSAPSGDDGSAAPAGDGGGAAESGNGGSSTSTTKSQQGTTPKTIPSVSSSSRSAFVAKAMIRHALGMKPISHAMKTQLNKMQELRDMGMTDKQNTMNQAMFPGTHG